MAQTMTPALVAGDDAGDPQIDHTADDPVPVPASDPVAVPDPEKVPALALSVMGSLVSLFEQLGSVVPMAHSLNRSLVAARTQFDQLVFHSTPPADQPK